MRDNERGAIMVEAAFTLTFFMFAILALLSVVNVCRAQSRIGVAVNQTAKEISQYTYLYGLTGLNDVQKQIYEDGQDAKESIDNVVNGIGTVYNNAASMSDEVEGVMQDPATALDAYDSISAKLGESEESIDAIADELEGIADDPKTFALGVAKILGNELTEEAKSKLIAAPLARVLMKKHLVNEENGDCEAYLKHLGVVPKGGSYIKGIDLGESVLCHNGSEDIIIIANYKVKVLELMGIEVKFEFTQTGVTKAWFGTSSDSDS